MYDSHFREIIRAEIEPVKENSWTLEEVYNYIFREENFISFQISGETLLVYTTNLGDYEGLQTCQAKDICINT